MRAVLDSTPSYFTQKSIRPPQEQVPAEDDDNGTDGIVPEPTPVQEPASAPRGLRKWLRKLPRPRKRLESCNPKRIVVPFKDRAPDNLSESSSSRSSQTGFTNRPGQYCLRS